jgi:hypothetical protein
MIMIFAFDALRYRLVRSMNHGGKDPMKRNRLLSVWILLGICMILLVGCAAQTTATTVHRQDDIVAINLTSANKAAMHPASSLYGLRTQTGNW